MNSLWVVFADIAIFTNIWSAVSSFRATEKTWWCQKVWFLSCVLFHAFSSKFISASDISLLPQKIILHKNVRKRKFYRGATSFGRWLYIVQQNQVNFIFPPYHPLFLPCTSLSLASYLYVFLKSSLVLMYIVIIESSRKFRVIDYMFQGISEDI